MESETSKSENEPGPKFTREQLHEAAEGLERLAQRLDRLWSKDAPLTAQEQRQVDLILNNALVIQEMLGGKMPDELK